MSTQRQKEWYRLRRRLGRKPTREELDSAVATKGTEGNKSNVAQQQHIAVAESNKDNVATLRPDVPTPKPEKAAAPKETKRVVFYGCIPVSTED